MPLFTFTPKINTIPSRAGTWATPKKILANNQATPILSANPNRLGLTITNYSEADLYVRCAGIETPASTEIYDRLIPAGWAYEWPPNEVPSTALNGIGIGSTSGGDWVISESAP